MIVRRLNDGYVEAASNLIALKLVYLKKYTIRDAKLYLTGITRRIRNVLGIFEFIGGLMEQKQVVNNVLNVLDLKQEEEHNYTVLDTLQWIQKITADTEDSSEKQMLKQHGNALSLQNVTFAYP